MILMVHMVMMAVVRESSGDDDVDVAPAQSSAKLQQPGDLHTHCDCSQLRQLKGYQANECITTHIRCFSKVPLPADEAHCSRHSRPPSSSCRPPEGNPEGE